MPDRNDTRMSNLGSRRDGGIPTGSQAVPVLDRASHAHWRELTWMASWAMRMGPAGWAMIRNGELRLTNRSFDALDRGSAIGPGWTLVSFATASAEEGSGRSLASIVVAEARSMLEQGDETRRLRVARGRQVVELVLEQSLLPGSQTSTRESPARSTRGAQLGVVLAMARDITEQVRAEQELAAATARLMEKERASVAGEVALGVAHDLGNLVGALRARLAVLAHQSATSAAGDEAIRENLAAMNVLLEAQSALVTRLGGIGRPNSEAPLAIELLSAVVRPAVDMVESWFRMRDRSAVVRIQVDAGLAELPLVIGLRDDLVNVLINIMINARDAMPSGGRVYLSGSVAGDRVTVRVEDEGTGIPSAILPRIFDPFFSTKGRAGTGLGLATARKVMVRLGGDIRARNLPTRGACFELEFAAVPRPEVHEPRRSASRANDELGPSGNA